MRIFLLQVADLLDLFLKVAIVMAAEVASSVVLQSLPVQNCLLFDCLQQAASLLLFNTQLVVDLLDLFLKLLDGVRVGLSRLACCSRLKWVLKEVVDVIKKLSYFDSMGHFGCSCWFLGVPVFGGIFGPCVAFWDVEFGYATAVILIVLLFHLDSLGLLVGPFNRLLSQRQHFLPLLNKLILGRGVPILLNSFLIYAILIFVLQSFALGLRLPSFCLILCQFILLQLFSILLDQLLKVHIFVLGVIFNYLLSMVHIFQNHFQPFLDLRCKTVRLISPFRLALSCGGRESS